MPVFDEAFVWIALVWTFVVSGLLLLAIVWPLFDKELDGIDFEVENVKGLFVFAGVGFAASVGALIVKAAGLFL